VSVHVHACVQVDVCVHVCSCGWACECACMCVSVCACACVCVYVGVQAPKGYWILGTGVETVVSYDVRPNSGPQEEQPVLLAAEPAPDSFYFLPPGTGFYSVV